MKNAFSSPVFACRPVKECHHQSYPHSPCPPTSIHSFLEISWLLNTICLPFNNKNTTNLEYPSKLVVLYHITILNFFFSKIKDEHYNRHYNKWNRSHNTSRCRSNEWISPINCKVHTDTAYAVNCTMS